MTDVPDITPHLNTSRKLLDSMRGERERIQWLSWPDRAAALVHLARASNQPIYTFSKQVPIVGSQLAAFNRGDSSTNLEWPELQTALELDRVVLMRQVAASLKPTHPELADELDTWAHQFGLEVPKPEENENADLAVMQLAKKVRGVRKLAKNGRVPWDQHPELLEELFSGWQQWTQVGNPSSHFFEKVQVHRDVFLRQFGERMTAAEKKPKNPKTSAKVKAKAKSSKTKTSSKATSKKAPLKVAGTKTTPVESITIPLSSIYIVDIDEDDGSLIADICFKPGTAEYRSVLRHAIHMKSRA